MLCVEELRSRLLTAGKIAEGDVQGGSHCMHPACLTASLRQSLAALNLETVVRCGPALELCTAGAPHTRCAHCESRYIVSAPTGVKALDLKLSVLVPFNVLWHDSSMDVAERPFTCLAAVACQLPSSLCADLSIPCDALSCIYLLPGLAVPAQPGGDAAGGAGS